MSGAARTAGVSGALLLAAALLFVGASALVLLSGRPVTAAIAVDALGIAIVLVVLLSRAAMPARVRGVLIGGVVIATLALGLRMDLFGTAGIVGALDRSGSGRTIGRTGDGGSLSPDARANDARPHDRGGAAVRLLPSVGGDDGWAARLNAALDGRIDVPDAGRFAITGAVTATRGETPGLLVRWAIVAGGAEAACGTTSVIGGDEAERADQLTRSFRVAAERSVALGRAACG